MLHCLQRKTVEIDWNLHKQYFSNLFIYLRNWGISLRQDSSKYRKSRIMSCWTWIYMYLCTYYSLLKLTFECHTSVPFTAPSTAQPNNCTAPSGAYCRKQAHTINTVGSPRQGAQFESSAAPRERGKVINEVCICC